MNSSLKDVCPDGGVTEGVGVGVGVGIGAGVGVGVGSGMGPPEAAGETSTAAMFHWSSVGAVSKTDTAVPAAWSVVSDWLQNVSPELARNWWSSVWRGATVRFVALSQSLPTARTLDPCRASVRETCGPPDGPLCEPTEPIGWAVSTPASVCTSRNPV